MGCGQAPACPPSSPSPRAGVGIAMLIEFSLVSLYYVVIIAWAIYYLVSSFQSPLPWSCDAPRNADLCQVGGPGRAAWRGPVPGWDAAGPGAARGPGRRFVLGEALPAAEEGGQAGAGARARARRDGRDGGDGGDSDGDLLGLCVAEHVGEHQPGQRQRGFLEVSPCVAASMCASLGPYPGSGPSPISPGPGGPGLSPRRQRSVIPEGWARTLRR